MKRVCVIPGDGIGPEVIASATSVLGELSLGLELLEMDAGLACHERTGSYLPDETLAAARGSNAVLFGAVTTGRGEGYNSPVLRLRKELGLYANVRRARSLLPEYGDVDITVIRENSEGLYIQSEREVQGGFVAEKLVTEDACRRIIEFAVHHCIENGIGRLVAVHKANVLRRSDGLFRDLFYEVTKGSSLDVEDAHVDAMATRMVQSPRGIGCIVTLNLYGDILSDMAAGLIGGLGMLPSANMGEGIGMFEPAHGSAPDIAGTGKANPVAAILSSALMLRYLGQADEAARIESAVVSALQGGTRTHDIMGEATTQHVTDAVIGALRTQATQ